MTTKERLHEMIDELSELEAADVLQVIEARQAGEWWAQKPERIELTAEEAGRFLDAMDHPGAAVAGLRELTSRARAYRVE